MLSSALPPEVRPALWLDAPSDLRSKVMFVSVVVAVFFVEIPGIGNRWRESLSFRMQKGTRIATTVLDGVRISNRLRDKVRVREMT